MARLSKKVVWAEMARRKLQFHPNKEWSEIRLWGLFNWGEVSHMIKEGDLLTDMAKENKTIWVRPSEKAYKENIEPLLNKNIEELTRLAGWNI